MSLLTLGRWAAWWPAVALAALVGLPAAGRAAWLGFRNDLSSRIGVQVAAVVNGRASNPARSSTLFPGEVSQDYLLQPGVRQIKIYNPRAPERVLFQANVYCASDLHFSIHLDRFGRVALTRIPSPMRPSPNRPGPRPIPPRPPSR